MKSFTPVTTIEQLESFGIPAPMNRDKVLDVLEDVHREWIAATTLVFVATLVCRRPLRRVTQG